MVALAKVLVIQVEVAINYGVHAPQRVKKKQAGVPPTQSVRYIVDEVDSMLVRVNGEERRRACNGTDYTPGSHTLTFFEDMHQSKSNKLPAENPRIATLDVLCQTLAMLKYRRFPNPKSRSINKEKESFQV